MLKKGRICSTFFGFASNPDIRPRRAEAYHSYEGEAGGNFLGGIKETGKSGRREVKHKILLHIITTQQGICLQGLSYPSSNQSKSIPLGLSRYLHVLRTKKWDMEKGIEAGRRMGKRGQRYDTYLPYLN